MLKDRVILITGASKGIGAQAAKLASRYGAKVIINYCRDEESAKKVLKEVKKYSPDSIALKANVSNKREVDKLIGLILNRFKRIDVVVNNASRSISYNSFLELKWDDFQNQLNVNLLGPFNVIKGVLPHMKEVKKGKIINILSSATIGTPPSKPIDYIASKYALLGFSKSLASELGPFGITINCISPGFTETDMIKNLPNKLKEMVAYQTPLKRIAEPNDIAKVIIFLCSEGSDYLTGVNIPVCGGNVMQ